LPKQNVFPFPTTSPNKALNQNRSKKNGNELWYHSPLRADDGTPSFKVNVTKNVWYDYGVDEGGTIIDLVTKLTSCSVRDALHELERSGLYSPALSAPTTWKSERQDWDKSKRENQINSQLAGQKEKGCASLELISADLLTDTVLFRYLDMRKIKLEVAQRYCSQIVFKPPHSPSKYFGVGFPAGDGFEVRNALNFKGFVGQRKDISVHEVPGAEMLQVFEGFTDFLAYLSHGKSSQQSHSVVVLNSTMLWRRVLPHIQNPQYKEIRLYFDNDDAGDHATANILGATDHPNINDMREHYSNFEDVNDWHQAQK
jgi:hypothetical protein